MPCGPVPGLSFKTFFLLFSLDIVSFLAGSCFFLPLTPYSLLCTIFSPPDSPTQHLPDIFTKFPFDIDRKENHSTHFLAQCVWRGGGGWGFVGDKEHDPGQGRERAARVYSALIIVYYSVDYYVSERETRESRKEFDPTLCTPGTPSGLWRYAQFVFIIENETRRGS